MSITKTEYENAIRYILSKYKKCRIGYPADIQAQRQILREYFLTTDRKIPETIVEKMNLILKYELELIPISYIEHIPVIGYAYPISIFKGLITTLNVDCLCTTKSTNEIVRDAAGPAFTNLLGTKSQSVLPGYNLLAKHIFYFDDAVIWDSITLINSHVDCLNKLRQIRKSSIAFGCIRPNTTLSKADTCIIVLNAVKTWLYNNFYKSVRIIFCTHDTETTNLYNTYAAVTYD